VHSNEDDHMQAVSGIAVAQGWRSDGAATAEGIEAFRVPAPQQL
jgi:hypothetical protein